MPPIAPANQPPVGWPGRSFGQLGPFAVALILAVDLALCRSAAGGEPSPARDALPHPGEPLAPLPTDWVVLAELQQAAGKRAQRYETEHFVVVHTATSATARKLAARLELVYRANVRLVGELQLGASQPRYKLPVLLFGTYEQFLAYRRDVQGSDSRMLGFYEPATGRIVLFDLATYPPVADLRAQLADLRGDQWTQAQELRRRLRRNLATLNATVVQHEAAHQIQQSFGIVGGDRAPAWLVEGLAQMFESPLAGGDSTLSWPNRLRLRELSRLHRDGGELLTGLRRIVRSDQPRLDEVDYCLSWVLADYLYQSRRGPLGAYIRHLAGSSEQPIPTADRRLAEFEQFFGPVDAELAGALFEHARGLVRCSASSAD